MSSTIKSSRISRREFGGLLAAGAALQAARRRQEPPGKSAAARLRAAAAAARPRSAAVLRTPDIHSEARGAPRGTVPDVAGAAAAGQRLSRRAGMESRVHGATGAGAAAATRSARMPVCRRARRTPLGGWEQPENGKRSSELRGHFVGHFLSASALLYASTGATRREIEGRFHGGGAGEVPAEAGRHVSQRLPHDVVGSSRRRPAGVGAVLHHSQDHGRHVRHVSTCRQQAGASGARGHGGMGRWMDRPEDRRAHAADSRRWSSAASPRRSTTSPPRPATIAGRTSATGFRRKASSTRWRSGATSCADCTPTRTSRRRSPPPAATRSRATRGSTMSPTISSTR